MTMKCKLAPIIHIIITCALINEMSMNVHARDNNNKRRTKEKVGGFQKNICDITDRDSKVHCYCENTQELRNATKAECWVFDGGIPPDDSIWQSFASQPSLQTLSFNVRVDGALNYVPTKALYYLQRLKSINIRYGNIVNVTKLSFANLTNLKETVLLQNQIANLQQYAFAHLPNITMINLEDNMIIGIDAEAFFDLPKLQKLVLTKNNISMIRNGTFQYTFNLLELDLNKNNIYHLHRRTFDGLANLRKLDLRQNRILNLTEFTFAELWNLQELLLGKNELRYISERAFDGLSQLRKLSLENNNLASLPSGLFEGVRGLTSLDLRSNKLHFLTFDNIKPILENLWHQNSFLLLEENNFVCDCRLKWMHALRNDTRSQITKDSINNVTCKMDPPMVSSAYNKMPEPNIKVDYNQDDLHDNSRIDTLSEEINTTDKKSLSEQQVTKLKRKVLNISPESLPCPRESTTTVAPPVLLRDTSHNEIRSSSFHGLSSGQAVRRLGVLVLCNVGFAFFFT